MTHEIDAGLPEKLERFHHGTHIEIVWTWFGWPIVAMTAFAIVWDGFLINWYLNVVPQIKDRMAMYGPLVHVAGGIAITYYAVAGWLNRTHISAGNGKIAVRHRPMPWFGNTDIDTSNLKQLYTKENIRRSRKGSYSTYDVRAVTRDGRDVRLVSGFRASEEAEGVEREIEKYLGIKDVPLHTEISWLQD